MHGWTYSEEEYRQHLPSLFAALQKGAPGAKLIRASTTPVRNDRDTGPRNDRIEARNRIAREWATTARVPVDDLYALMPGHAGLHSDNVHFNKEGSAMLAEQVARAIARLFPGRARATGPSPRN